jgi:ferric-dicitrate binding protein FerR (iron transport regulator)
MNCLQRDEITRLADGELTPTQAQVAQLHAVSCTSCRLWLDSLRAEKQALRNLSAPAMPADLQASLLAMSPPPQRQAPRLLALAAVAACAVFLWTRLEVFTPGVEISADYLTEAHHQYALTLPLAPTEKLMTEAAPMMAGQLEGPDVY